MQLFKNEIQQDEGICSNCFRKQFETEEVRYLVQNDGYAKRVRKSLRPVIQDYREYEPDTSFVNVPKECEGRTSCCDCGMMSTAGQMRPLSKPQLIAAGQRVLERLDEKGYELSEDEFFDTLRDLKSDPSEQCKDDSILGRATSAAVQSDSHVTA